MQQLHLFCTPSSGLVNPPTPGAAPEFTRDDDLTLAAAPKSEPAVILFYRGGWCPYCTKHLSAMMEIEGKLRDQGYSIFAISTDQPSKLAATPGREKLNYTILSDSKMGAANAFGITFTVSDETLEKYKGYNIDLEAASGGKAPHASPSGSLHRGSGGPHPLRLRERKLQGPPRSGKSPRRRQRGQQTSLENHPMTDSVSVDGVYAIQ